MEARERVRGKVWGRDSERKGRLQEREGERVREREEREE